MGREVAPRQNWLRTRGRAQGIPATRERLSAWGGGQRQDKIGLAHGAEHPGDERKAFGMGRGAAPRQNWPRTRGRASRRREKGFRHGEGGSAKTKLASHTGQSIPATG